MILILFMLENSVFASAFFMSRFTTLSVTWMLAIVNGLEVIKCLIAFVMVRSGIWIKNIVKE